MTTPEHAARLRKRGFANCRPDPEEKKPTYQRWGTYSLEAIDFAPGDMLGILGGPLSDGGQPGHALIIIDLDSSEANGRADEYLPATAMMEGRASKPRSHRYYLVPVESIPSWAISEAEQSAAAAIEKTGHAGPFKKCFRHRETKATVFDFIGTGGQVVCPPSLWVSEDRERKEYREWEGGEPGEPAIVAFPVLWDAAARLASACGAEVPWSQSVFRVPAKAAPSILERARKYLEKIPGAVSGAGGHNQTFTAARALVWGFDLSQDDALNLLSNGYNSRCSPPWSEKELRHKIEDADRVPCEKPRGWLRDAERKGQSKKKSVAHAGVRNEPGSESHDAVKNDQSPDDSPHSLFTDTDVANGRRFAAEHSGAIRYVADWGVWVIYDGRRWQIDRSETRVEQLAKETIDRMAQEAAAKAGAVAKQIAGADDEEEKVKLSKAHKAAVAELMHAKKSADMRAIRRMLQAARSEPALCIPEGREVFDLRRDLLNCQNGTIELQNGTLREHRPCDYITRICPLPYTPKASRKTYLDFLATVFDGKPAVAEYVRDLSGYIVTGEVTDQTLNIFNGDGSNGKNVLVDTWKSILGEGEYAHSAAAELLVGDGWERHPTEKTGLRGARLVVCSETGEDGQLDETKMKSLTGGDTVTARYMRGDYFQFEPTHKLILLTNNKPRVRGTDHGVWRRLRLVPFAVRFWKEADRELEPDGEFLDRFQADPGLGERLRTTEAEGILADMVSRAVAFYLAGRLINPPAEVVHATNDYRSDQDVIGQFFAARVREDALGKVKASDFYAAFKKWWEGEGYAINKAPGPRKFGIEASRKFHRSKASGSVYAVRLLESDSFEAGEDGRMGGDLGIKSRARAPIRDFNRESAPILPTSLTDGEPEDPADVFERDAIREFGGG